MFEIMVQSETGRWFRVDEPYAHADSAVTDAVALADKYDAHGYIIVLPVEGR